MLIKIDDYRPAIKESHWFKPACLAPCGRKRKGMTDGSLFLLTPPKWERQDDIARTASFSNSNDVTTKFIACEVPTSATWIEVSGDRFMACFDQNVAIDGRYYDGIISLFPDVQFFLSDGRYEKGPHKDIRLMSFHSTKGIEGWVVPFLGKWEANIQFGFLEQIGE